MVCMKVLLKYISIFVLLVTGGCINLPESCIPPLTYDLIQGAKARISSTNTAMINANGHYMNDYEEYFITDPITNKATKTKLPSADMSKYGKWFDTGVDVVSGSTIKVTEVAGLYYVGDSLCATPQIQQLPDNTYYIDYQKLQNDGYADFSKSIVNPCPTITNIKRGATSPINTGINVRLGDVIEITAFKLGSSIKDPGSNKVIAISDSPLKQDYFSDKLHSNPSSLIGLNLSQTESDMLKSLYDSSDDQKKRELKYLLGYLSKLKLQIGTTPIKAYLFSGFTSPNLNTIIGAPYDTPRIIRILNSGTLSFKFDPIDDSFFNDESTFGGFFFKIYRGEVFNGGTSTAIGSVEMVLANCANVPAGLSCDPNTTLSSISSINKIITGTNFTANSNGRLWLRVADTSPDKYYNNIGNVKITWESEKFAAPVSKIYKDIVDLMMSYTESIGKAIYNNLIKETGLYKIIQILCLLYVVTSAFMYITGFAKYEAMDLVASALKLGIVATLIGPDSYKFFNETVFGFIRAIPTFLISNLSDQYASNEEKDNPFFFMDDSLSLIFNAEILQRVFMLILMPGGILVFIAFIYIIYCVLKTFIRVLLSYIIAMFMVGFLISATPIFVPFVLYKYQLFKDTFEKWINLMLRYSVEPALLIVGLAIISKIMFALMVSSFPTLYMCLKCMLPIDLTNIPIIGTFLDHALCISGYLPWGVEYIEDNAAARTAMIFMQLFVMAITLGLLAIVYSKYPDYVAQMTTQLTGVYITGGLGVFKSQQGGFKPADVLNKLLGEGASGLFDLGIWGGKKLGGIISDKVMRDKGDITSDRTDDKSKPVGPTSGNAPNNQQVIPEIPRSNNSDLIVGNVNVTAANKAFAEHSNMLAGKLGMSPDYIADPIHGNEVLNKIHALTDPHERLEALTNLHELYKNKALLDASEALDNRSGKVNEIARDAHAKAIDIQHLSNNMKDVSNEIIMEAKNLDIYNDKMQAHYDFFSNHQSNVNLAVSSTSMALCEELDTLNSKISELNPQIIDLRKKENKTSEEDTKLSELYDNLRVATEEKNAKDSQLIKQMSESKDYLSGFVNDFNNSETQTYTYSTIDEAESYFTKDEILDQMKNSLGQEEINDMFEEHINILQQKYNWDNDKVDSLFSGFAEKANEEMQKRGGYKFTITRRRRGRNKNITESDGNENE